ncbi:hypothetical protein Bca101_102037 [Brassica carinata]
MDGAEARPIPAAGQEPGLDDLPTLETAQPEVSKVNSLWSMEQCRQGKSAKWIRNSEKDWLEGWARGPSSNPPTVGGLLEPLTWRATASCRPGTDWERLFRAFPGAEQPTQNCALNVKVKKFNQARFPLSLSTIQLNHSQGNGLGRISGKEDPVELDSSPTLCPKMSSTRTEISWEQKGKSSLDSDFQYEYEPQAAHSDAAFDPSMSALPIIVKQNSPSVGLLTDEMQPSCAQVSPKHPDGALTPERAFVTVVSTAPDSPRKGERAVMRTDGQSSWAKITHGQSSPRGLKSPDSPRKGQRVDMRIDDSPRGRKSPTTVLVGENHPRTVLVGINHPRIVHGRANVLICASTDSLRGRKSPDSPRKGQRVDMRIDDSPRGENHPRTVLVAKITHDSPRGENHPRIVHGRANALICASTDSPRWRKSPTDSPRGLNISHG